jgi:hypothetical protein
VKPKRPPCSLRYSPAKDPIATVIPLSSQHNRGAAAEPIGRRGERARDHGRGHEVRDEQGSDGRNLRIVADGGLLEVVEADAEQGQRTDLAH